MDNNRATRVFEMLVRQNEAMLITYIRAMVPDASLADDIFQDTMITAWKRFDDYDQTRPLGPWLRGIAANLMRNAGRKRAADPLVFSESVQQFIEQAVEVLDRQPGDQWSDRISELRDCLEQLPSHARQLIHDRYDDGLNASQIAGKMEVSASSVRKRLQRIRDVLLKCLRNKLPELRATTP